MWFAFSLFLENVTIEIKIYQQRLKKKKDIKEMSKKKKTWTNGIQLWNKDKVLYFTYNTLI